MPSEAEERERLLSRYGLRLDAGAVVFRDGEPAREAYLLHEGRVRLFKQLGAVERSLRVVRPGELFGESALLRGTLRTSTAIALDTVQALRFEKSSFDDVLVESPELFGRVLEQLVRRLAEAEDEIEILLLSDAQSKIIVALLKLAQHRLLADGRQGGKLALSISPLELSARVGLDVDSVKRIVIGLRESGYVRIQDEKVEIPDLDALRELYGLLGIENQLRGERAREGARARPR